MRHTFRFPRHIQQAVKKYVERAISHVDPQRFRQEQPYITALVSQLEGVVYDGNDGYIKITSTIADDRGRDSAEKRVGADLAITATIGDKLKKIRKAILVQAKLTEVMKLGRAGEEDLIEQIRKMRQHTRSPKVMEIVEFDERRVPRILSGNKLLARERCTALELGDYFVRRILTTLDGDTRTSFVEAVQQSELTKLSVLAKVVM